MSDSLAIITSYNREQSLSNEIEQLQKLNFDVVVFDDCSSFDANKLQKNGISVIVNKEHRGKKLFWKTYQDIFDYCKSTDYKYYLFLPDDVIIPNDFDNIYSFIDRDGIDIISPLFTNTVERQSRWGHKNIQVYKDCAKTHYFDCCGITTKTFFETLDWRIYAVSNDRWSIGEHISSGVGEQITLRLQQKHFNMYHTIPSVLSTIDIPSEMNKEERVKHPLISNNPKYKDCIDVYIASLYRDGFIINTLNSLLQPEVHSIGVSLNNYTDEQANEVMSAIKDKRIKWHRTNNEKCSNEKLRFVCEGSSRYVAFADDDLIYAPDHFKNLISKCEAWNGGVSIHGGVFKQIPIKSYYGGRNVYRCLDNQEQDVEVDILGNGVALYKREWLSKDEWKELYDNATNVSMDDIYVSCAMNKKGIHLYVVAHDKITHKEKKESDNYVADKYCNNDSVQVDYINNNYKRIFQSTILTPRNEAILQRFKKQYPRCEVWIEDKYIYVKYKTSVKRWTL